MDFAIFLAILVVLLFSVIWRASDKVLWRPYKFTRIYEQQGIKGEPYKLIRGSLMEIKSLHMAARDLVLDLGSHNFIPKVLPHYYKWSSQYGKTFFYWWGTKPRICIRDPEMVKQVLSNKFGFFPKPKPGPEFLALIGKGLVVSEGEDWARHRRVVSPAFTMDKLKMMTEAIADCVITMFDGWKDGVSGDALSAKEIEMAGQFKELTANVISHTAFGSSFKEGKEAFVAQQELVGMVMASMFNLRIPGRQHVPTKWNLRKRMLEKRMTISLTRIIKSRLDRKDSGYGNDLLGLMLEASAADKNKGGVNFSMDEIIDECKTFFFAGHETTSHLLTWTTFLLSTNPDWQERLRNEVLEECGIRTPNADMLGRLRLVNMVLLEALRLYCPVSLISREAATDMNLGNLKIVKGTAVTIPIALIHRDKEYWGEDADQFNPMRFENGVIKASKHPNALISFSMGPRNCVGQNFAMLEAKTVLAMMLQKFTFSISPRYKHAPTSSPTLQPQYGLPVIVKSL